MKNSEEVKQKLLELQVLDEHIKEVQQQFVLVSQKTKELNDIVEALSDLNSLKTDSEMLAQIGQGVFVKAKLGDTKDVVMNIGADTAIECSAEEAKKIIQEQATKLQGYLLKIKEKLEQATMYAQNIQQDILSLQAKKELT